MTKDHKSRAHAFASASASSRWLVCTPSAALAAQYPPRDTAFTQEGTRAHEVAELIASGVTVTPTDNITPEMIRHATEYRDYIEGLKTEDTMQLLEQRVDFSEWVPNGFGTADCILLHDNVMDVIDYKYGQGVAVSADHNSQMMLYGLGALHDYGFIFETKTIRLHIFQPRIDNISVYELTANELLSWGKQVKPIAKKATEGKGKAVAGKHCRFCPHAGRCTALARYAIESASIDDTIAPDPDTLTPEAIAKLLYLEPVISMWIKWLREHATAELLDGKDIPGYKLVEGKPGNRKWIDELKVAEALDAAGIAREDYTTVSLLSPAAMDKALGKKRAAELLDGMTSRSAGAPTLAPVTDKRPMYNREAEIKKDFE